MLVLGLVVLLVAAACGNSKAKAVSTTTTSGQSSGGGATVPPAPGKHVAVTAPGVTDTEIRVGGVASVTNPLGGKYGDAFDGRRPTSTWSTPPAASTGASSCSPPSATTSRPTTRSEVQGLLTQDHVFAVLPVATLLFTGAQTLVDQNVPTFGWTINPEWEGTAKDARSQPVRPGRLVPLLHCAVARCCRGWPSAWRPQDRRARLRRVASPPSAPTA